MKLYFFVKKLSAVVLISGLLLAGGCGEDYRAEKLLWRAQRLATKLLAETEKAPEEDFQRVVDAYRKILTTYPDWGRAAEVQLALGQIYYRRKDYARAEEELKKVLENYPEKADSCVEAQSNIALVYEEQGDWEQALVEYKKVVDNYPAYYRRTFEIPLHIASRYQQENEEEKAAQAFEEAIAGFRKIIEENPKSELAAISQGYIAAAYLALNKQEEAIAAFNAIIDDYPENPRAPLAFLDIARVYRENLNQPDKAVTALQEFIRRYPEHSRAKNVLTQIARIHLDEDEPDLAEAAYRRILSDYPKDKVSSAQAQLALGAIYETKGDWENAELEYEKVIAEYPDTGSALEVPLIFVRHYRSLADEEKTRTAEERALTRYRRTIQENPGTSLAEAAQEYIARVYAVQEKWEETVEALKVKIKEYPDSPQIESSFFEIAEIYRRILRNPQEAINYYEQLARLYPESSLLLEARYQSGRIHMSLGEYDQAESIFTRIFQEYPEDRSVTPRARFSLAELYERQEQWKKARAGYEQVVEEYPDHLSGLEAAYSLAETYRKTGDSARAASAYEEALKRYQEVVNEKPGTLLAEAALELSVRIYTLVNKWEKAEEFLLFLADTFPDSVRKSEYLLRLAGIYQSRLSNPEKAVATYRRILSEFPQHPLREEMEKQIESLEGESAVPSELAPLPPDDE